MREVARRPYYPKGLNVPKKPGALGLQPKLEAFSLYGNFPEAGGWQAQKTLDAGAGLE